MRAAPALLTLGLLAACSPSGQAVQKQETARAAELDKLKGWDRAFEPDAAIAAANQFGYRNDAYAAAKAGPGFVSTGTSPMIAGSTAASPNQTNFVASGAAADKIDRMAFTLSITDPQTADHAKKRFTDIVNGFLFQFKLDAKKDVSAFLADEKPLDATYQGATFSAAATPTPGGAKDTRRLTVTFTRTGASAPVNSQTQGK
jgi:hypothetical protein